MVQIKHIYRYPVKGLSPQSLPCVALTQGKCLPWDRSFAIENGTTDFDPDNPQHFQKIKFLMLMRNERLATLRTEFDEASGVLTVMRGKKQLARGQLTDRVGRKLLEQFFSAYMKDELRGPPHLVSAPGHQFSDTPKQVVSLINLTSVAELERVIGNPVDPLRFRGNVHLEQADLWEEMKWVGKTIQMGAVRLKVLEPIVRCAATNVNLETATRDMNIPQTLMRAFDHNFMGVYAEVLDDGEISVGDKIIVAE